MGQYCSHTHGEKVVGPMSGSLAPSGRFVSFNLHTRDIPAARQFYTALFDWTATKDAFACNGKPVGKLVQLKESTHNPKPVWIGCVGAQSRRFKKDVKRAKRNRAVILDSVGKSRKSGHTVVFEDTEGALFGIIRLSKKKPPPTPAGVNEFSWSELWVPNQLHALQFYKNTFSWMHDAGEYPEKETYAVVKQGDSGETHASIVLSAIGYEGEVVWLHYVRVDNVKETMEKAEKLGARVLEGIHSLRGGAADGRYAVLRDPQGGEFGIYELESDKNYIGGSEDEADDLDLAADSLTNTDEPEGAMDSMSSMFDGSWSDSGAAWSQEGYDE